MNRGVKIAALILMHIVVFAGAAASLAGYRTRAVFIQATADPRYRIGLAMTLPSSYETAHSLTADLNALAKTAQPRTADVVRLATLLQQGRLNDAGAQCTALGWRSCDSETLAKMRKTVAP